MADMNEHIAKGDITEFLNHLNLKEGITNKHAPRHGYASTHQNGSEPIDGIFVLALG